MTKNPLAASIVPMTEDRPPTLLDAQDTIGKALNFVEATFMAASDLNDRGQAAAIHALAMVTQERLEEVLTMLEAIRAKDEVVG